MDEKDGRIVGENALDSIAIAEERYPGSKLLLVQTKLVVKYEGRVREIKVTKEKV